MSKKQIQITMAFLAFVASLHASSGRRGLDDLTASLKGKSAQLSKEAEQAAAERAFLDKQKAIMNQEEQGRLSIEHEQGQESDQNNYSFHAGRNRISAFENRERARLSVFDDAADEILPTADEEEQAYNQMMDDFHTQKAAIEKKEANYERVTVRLADGSILKARKDVLELSPFLKEFFSDGEENSKVLSLPENVKPEVIRLIFTFLESLLTPGLKKPDLFKKAPNDDLLEFIKINKDLFNTLRFLNLMPEDDLPILVSPGHNMYDYMSKGHPTKENAILYHQNDPITPEIAKIFIRQDMEKVQKFTGWLYGDDHFVVKSHEDIQFLQGMTTDIMMEFSKDIILKSFDVASELTEDELIFLMDKKYRIKFAEYEYAELYANEKEMMKENPIIVPVFADLPSFILESVKMPDCALKTMIKEATLKESKINFDADKIKTLDGLPEDIYQHLLGGAAYVRLNNIIEAIGYLSEGTTQGEKILKDRIFKELKSATINEIKVRSIKELESLHKLPEEFKSKFTFDLFSLGIVVEIKNEILEVVIRQNSKDKEKVASIIKELISKKVQIIKPTTHLLSKPDAKKVEDFFNSLNGAK